MKNYLFLFVFVQLLFQCTPAKKENNELPSEQNDLPAITLMMADGSMVKANTLSGKCMFIFFVPDCDHCQRQAMDIQRHIDIFKDFTLYFIASNPIQEVNHFAEKYSLQGYQNVFFARAKVEEVYRILGPMSVPTVLLYSNRKRLIKKFDGETPVEVIARAL